MTTQSWAQFPFIAPTICHWKIYTLGAWALWAQLWTYRPTRARLSVNLNVGRKRPLRPWPGTSTEIGRGKASADKVGGIGEQPKHADL